jgi:hypothetical protein
MQLMPDTARRFGVSHPFDPIENVLGAARFLAYLHENVGIEDLPMLLAAYNAGEGAVWHYRGIPPYRETREYVRRVLLTYLLGNREETVPVRTAIVYRRNGVSAGPVIDGTVARHPIPSWLLTQRTRPKTEADVLSELEQIKAARLQALKNRPRLHDGR